MIKIEKSGYQYRITLNRPEKRNALSIELLRELDNAIPDTDDCKGLHLLTLEGAGAVFCAGADLEFLKQIQDLKKAEEYAFILDQVLEKLNMLDIPVISRVQGACMAGANGLLAVSDLVLAEKDTCFSFSEVKLGLVPAIISTYVLQKINFSAALDIMLTGRVFDADEAMKIGLVNRISTKETWEADWENLLSQLSDNAPLAMKRTRRMIRGMKTSIAFDQAAHARELFLQGALSEEAKVGIKAFFEKKKPDWSKIK
jgi:methylglutaconyl-CoA hydratase